MIGNYGSDSKQPKLLKSDGEITSLDILQNVLKRKLKGVMFHDDLQTCFDFLNMHGFKREQEYRTLSEMAEFKSLERYIINHYDVMPNKETDRLEVNPLNLKSVQGRKNISTEQKKQMLKVLFDMWCEWEDETRGMLEMYTTSLAKMECNIDAKKIRKLLEDVAMEYKYIERRVIEYNNVEWSLHHMYMEQDSIHEKFKEKLEKEIKIDMC